MFPALTTRRLERSSTSGAPGRSHQSSKTVDELRSLIDSDPSLEFDALFRLGATFPDPTVRLACVNALSFGGGIKVAQTLIATLASDESIDVRVAAARAMHVFSDPSQARSVSGQTIGRIKSALREAAVNDEIAVRGQALISLAAMRDEEYAELVETTYDEALEEPELLPDVLTAMGESGERLWLHSLEDAIYSSIPAIRSAAVIAFGKLATEENVELLDETLEDPDLEVQKATIQALATIGTDTAREMLNDATESAEPEVRQLAQKALETLKAEDDLMYAVSPDMVGRGLFGAPLDNGGRRDVSRYDAPTQEGWADVRPEGDDVDAGESDEGIGEDLEDYFESDDFYRDSNLN